MSTPTKAFILGAGYGTRMQPLTLQTPKPLVKISDKPLLDHICDHLKTASITDIMVNTHHLPEKIEQWARTRTDLNISLSYEETLLDTAGGIANVLEFFQDEPFYVIAGDSFWIERNNTTIFEKLASTWSNETIDILMTLQDIKTMTQTTGVGDYDINTDQTLPRSRAQTGTHMFTNIRINHPRIFKNIPKDKPSSFLALMDKAQQEKRLYGIEHDLEWHHISTPEDLARVNKHVQSA